MQPVLKKVAVQVLAVLCWCRTEALELPPADKVIEDLRVQGARESAARAIAGLEIVANLAGTLGATDRIREYTQAATTLESAVLSTYDPWCSGRQCDKHRLVVCKNQHSASAAFRREVVDRYVTAGDQDRRLGDLKTNPGPWQSAFAWPAGTRFRASSEALAWCADWPLPFYLAEADPPLPKNDPPATSFVSAPGPDERGPSLPSAHSAVDDLGGTAVSRRETVARTNMGLEALAYIAEKWGNRARADEYRTAARDVRRSEVQRYMNRGVSQASFNQEATRLSACEGLYSSDAFKREILDRYSPRGFPAVRDLDGPRKASPTEAGWARALTLQAGTHADLKEAPRLCVDPGQSSTDQVAVAATGPPDRSAAKGQKAGTDMLVFGLPLGQNVAFPACPEKLSRSTTCGWVRGDAADLYLAFDRLPEFVSSRNITAVLRDGVLMSVRADMANNEPVILEALRTKYRQEPRLQNLGSCSKGYRGAHFTDAAYIWDVPGLHVEYARYGCSLWGFESWLLIETEDYHAARLAAERREAAKKPKL
jgi:hypothetical protein